MTQQIWIPTALRSNSQHPILASANQFYGLEQVLGTPSSTQDVVEQLAPISRDDALRLLCSHSMALISEGGMAPLQHLVWARNVLPPEWVAKIQQLMVEDGAEAGCLFHRRSAWFVLQMALLTCHPRPSTLPNEELSQRIWRACFCANDVVTGIENRRGAEPEGDIADWMITTVVPLHGIDSRAIDFAQMGRAQLLWSKAAESQRFVRELGRIGMLDFETAFVDRYGISLTMFLQFLTALYVRFFKSKEGGFDPIKLNLRIDPLLQIFPLEFRRKAISLIAQRPDELLLNMFSARQSWVYDVSFLRERPLLELDSDESCCPDPVLLTRASIDRVYFLLQDACGKNKFRQSFGYLFEEYVHLLFDTFMVSNGPARTYWQSPKFVGEEAQAADGVLRWANTAVLLECKAGLLTTRQRFSGFRQEMLDGIDCLLGNKADKTKGIAQLARTLKRVLSGDTIHTDDQRIKLELCERIYPVLVCFDEPLAMHAVTRRLQRQFKDLCDVGHPQRNKIGPLMLLSVRDLEMLSAIGHSVSVERIFHEYSHHLDHQPKDFTGSFTSVLNYHFGKHIELVKTPNYQQLFSQLDEIAKLVEALPKDGSNS